MKKILITGANSYIGMSFEKYINENYSDNYIVDTVDMIDGTWREKDFSGYDAVFHVAGIAHQKETKENKSLYYKVNTELAVETAQKAKDAKISQFVFLSTMSVYGVNTGIITKETQPNPKSNYGRSKLEAEKRLEELQNNEFKVCIIRPPMVYGDGCKGNYQTIIKIVKKFPFFPKIKNQRSLIHIDNLCSFIEMVVRENLSGKFYPQNEKYVRTDEMAMDIAKSMGKKIRLSATLGFFVKCMRPFFGVVQKAFGNLTYEETEEFNFSYCLKKEE